ncbi:hypothetical protein F5J12DRAFT_893423 [Pisolithus orientalis]|uniref:uncharacterized protein n=1 Tax=Pisolithus orientalis TaxID=936130 RepID=UPI0022241405|nr:uncharacterized protein F5J12DRAFT_893423 [Pisolithus orientalis]KAI6004341.1 hypothetical protein F5J12DRAFT_893423 [Pisolithus orientalis]
MSADGAIKSTLQSPPLSAPMLLNTHSPPQLDHADYAKTRCWTEEDWKRWCMTPEGQGANSQMSFLEDKNGEALPAARITNILQAMRSIWHEFHKYGLINAQTTWSSMPLTLKKAFHLEIMQSFPELNLCADHWKSDMLAKKHYSSFKQTWFTNRSDEKVASFAKCKMKTETAENMVSPTPKWPKLPLGSQLLTEGDGSASDSLQIDMPNEPSPTTHSNSLLLTFNWTNDEGVPTPNNENAHAPGKTAYIQFWCY